MTGRSVRLPLHVGVDSLFRAGLALAMLVPGASLAVGGVLGLVAGEGGVGRLVVGVLVVACALLAAAFAWSSRASDVVLDDAGVMVDGGEYDGQHLAWGALAAVEVKNADRDDVDHYLHLRAHDGRRWVIDAADPVERASLGALAGTLRARLGELDEPPPTRADVATCRGCGAPVPPSDRHEVRCEACGTVNAVAPELRQRVAAQRAADETRRATADAVRELLDQPGAKRASGTAALAAIVALVGWGAVVTAWAWMGLRSLDWFGLGLGVFTGWALTFAAFAFARVSLARRRALQVLTSTFAARPPARPGASPGCRSCGAPLAESGSVVVRCGYCDVESVLGLGVRPILRQVAAHRGSVEDLLRDQRAERGRWVKLALLALAATAAGGFWSVVQVAVSREVAEARARCEGGSAAHCFELANGYVGGGVVKKDDAAAVRYYGLACDGGHAEACRDLAVHLEMGWGVAADAEGAREKRERACELGFQKACEELQGDEH